MAHQPKSDQIQCAGTGTSWKRTKGSTYRKTVVVYSDTNTPERALVAIKIIINVCKQRTL